MALLNQPPWDLYSKTSKVEKLQPLCINPMRADSAKPTFISEMHILVSLKAAAGFIGKFVFLWAGSLSLLSYDEVDNI